MCPKDSQRRVYRHKRLHKQRGFLLPLSLFIVVVMGVFALVLSRNTVQTSSSSVLEVISTQAFYAAESGAQSAMQSLFFPDASSRQAVDSRCVALNALINYSVTGLNNCSSTATCVCQFQDGTSCAPVTAGNYSTSAASSKLISYYKVSSVGSCGTGNLSATRTVEAGSVLKQE